MLVLVVKALLVQIPTLVMLRMLMSMQMQMQKMCSTGACVDYDTYAKAQLDYDTDVMIHRYRD